MYWTFQGLILGNPVLNRENLVNVIAGYRQWGMIDTQGALAVQPLQDAYAEAIHRGQSAQAAEVFLYLQTYLYKTYRYKHKELTLANVSCSFVTNCWIDYTT